MKVMLSAYEVFNYIVQSEVNTGKAVWESFEQEEQKECSVKIPHT